MGTRVSAFSLFYRSFPRNRLTDYIESHFSCYKIPPHTLTEWESHLTWLSEMGVTFDLSLNWLSRNGSYNLTQCHALLPTSHARDFWAWVCRWLFWFCKTLHHHFQVSLVFDLCDFVSFDNCWARRFSLLLWWTFALLCPKINNLIIWNSLDAWLFKNQNERNFDSELKKCFRHFFYYLQKFFNTLLLSGSLTALKRLSTLYCCWEKTLKRFLKKLLTINVKSNLGMLDTYSYFKKLKNKTQIGCWQWCK